MRMRSTPRPRDRFVIIAGSSKPVEALHTPVPLELPPSGSAPRGAWSPQDLIIRWSDAVCPVMPEPPDEVRPIRPSPAMP